MILLITISISYAAVVIGFSDSNTSVVLTEGAPFSPICISIKQGGFPLHPRGNLELTIQTESIGTNDYYHIMLGFYTVQKV